MKEQNKIRIRAKQVYNEKSSHIQMPQIGGSSQLQYKTIKRLIGQRKRAKKWKGKWQKVEKDKNKKEFYSILK